MRRSATTAPGAPSPAPRWPCFCSRAPLGSAYAPPPATGTVFARRPRGDFAAAWIEDLARRGSRRLRRREVLPDPTVTRGRDGRLPGKSFVLQLIQAPRGGRPVSPVSDRGFGVQCDRCSGPVRAARASLVLRFCRFRSRASPVPMRARRPASARRSPPDAADRNATLRRSRGLRRATGPPPTPGISRPRWRTRRASDPATRSGSAGRVPGRVPQLPQRHADPAHRQSAPSRGSASRSTEATPTALPC